MSSNLPNINNKLVIETHITIEAPITIPDDGTMAILFIPVNITTFENIEEEVLLCTLPKQWGKLNLILFAIRFQILL
ncbi:1242_t:CDS:2, partial [Gigaspora margarita]